METTTKTDKTVAIEILKQLGGNRFIAMTGAKNFICDNNSMGFRIPGTMTKDRINFVKITHNALDTYDLEFKSLWGDKLTTVSTFEGAYNDMLRDIISSRTGLRLSL